VPGAALCREHRLDLLIDLGALLREELLKEVRHLLLSSFETQFVP
jgi:hypothetical protein